ncbi:two-component sensor histidine kinase [Tenacibaculum adriaticum]|uniref:histidine kinase n=1 Tax=Tenacibaculum adriaticum TaxID=413713 RepID=A0A5S5DW65_9FLAO|nr:sensor histidine kinase [Tenacibaculum adriaticum]TYP99518.1 two-component sensor histidine kinase [Tenacibaculum adriaticum]
MVDNTLLKEVTYAIVFLLIILTSIIVFIIKSRSDRQNIQSQKLEIEQVLSQKTVLLKEIHHRVKNNLQLISGLLYLQSKKYKNPEIENMLNDLQRYINSIALVHEMLYNEKTLSTISMDKYVRELGSRLVKLSEDLKISLEIKIKKIMLPVNYATTLGLILNELITNSIKYAFEGEVGVIEIIIKYIGEDEYEFEYKDNGVGMNLNSNKGDRKTLGLRLIKMFSEEIDANLNVKNDNGLSYTLNFKIK